MSQPSSAGRRSRFRRFMIFGVPALAALGLGFAARAHAFGPWRGGCHGHARSPEEVAEHVEHRVERMLKHLDATPTQRAAILGVTQVAAPNIASLAEEGRGLRKRLVTALTAKSIDRAEVERVHAELDQLADRAADVGLDTMLKVAEQLTSEQRAKVAEHLARFAPDEE